MLSGNDGNYSSGALMVDDENCVMNSTEDIDKFIKMSYYDNANIKLLKKIKIV